MIGKGNRRETGLWSAGKEALQKRAARCPAFQVFPDDSKGRTKPSEGKGLVSSVYNPQLETFLCVVECGSFNKAAEKLYISPPAVIKQINLLEDNLDLQLFTRTPSGPAADKSGAISLSGRKVHHPILQRLCDAGAKRHARKRQPDPHWHIAHDAGSGAGGSVARAAGGLPWH